MPKLEWTILTKKRESATKGVPAGKEALAWVTNIRTALTPARSLGSESFKAILISKFPARSLAAVKERVNAIALAPVEDFRRDSDLFGQVVRTPEVQSRIRGAMERGLQTREAEMTLTQILDDPEARRW